MPDLEKVIKGLKCHAELNCVECPYRDGWRTCPFGETLLADAIALLKEQAPVKPIIEHGKMYPQCGNCGEWLLKSDKYCSACGKKVL